MNDLSEDFTQSEPLSEGKTWTPERIEDLKALWKIGQSASQIASKLGHGITRNAVIGRLHRLGLTEGSRDVPRAPREPRASRAKGEVATPPVTLAIKPAPKAKLLPIRPLAPPVAPSGPGVSILQLTSETCRWPQGDPGTPDFHYCGHGTREGSPYCEYHARIAYQPLQDRKRGGYATNPLNQKRFVVHA